MRVPLSVLEFRDRAAAFFGDVEGVVDGDRRFSYAEYAERTHRLAMAGFKVPKSFEFRESLPKGGTGEILKAELRELFWAGQAKRVN